MTTDQEQTTDQDQEVSLDSYCLGIAKRAKRAAADLTRVTGEQKNSWLIGSARLIRHSIPAILDANKKDLAAAPGYGLTDAQIDRLRLTEDRIEGIAAALEEVGNLPEPVGRVIDSTVRPNGLRIDKVSVPLGVVFFIYESRPNVTADAAAICSKAGNAVILRGGKEAQHSSRVLVDLLNAAADAAGLPRDAVQLVSTTDRAAVGHLLKMDKYIDVAIPRGGEGLIRRVVDEATMPVIKHFHGNCHVYIDSEADLNVAEAVTVNSKCHRLGVCNAAESLVVHSDIAAEAIPRLVVALNKQEIEVRGCPRTCELAPSAVPATEEDYGAEYLGPVMSAIVVGSLDEAVEHINEYGSGHTESIVTTSLAAAEEFARRVDSAAVMINASTRFNDGGQFGLGAEIGISTDKFHARGPCGVNELTSYKYIVHGQGHTRR